MKLCKYAHTENLTASHNSLSIAWASKLLICVFKHYIKLTIKFFLDGNNKLKKSKDGKPTRVRTVLSEKQLHTLRTCYGANPRPDALMKEQLVEMTGLSPRVIRVWFQNKRCKDKKKSMLLKHMQQQEKVRVASSFTISP